MHPDSEHIELYDRLGRFLAGESDPAETAWVENWLAASAENEKTFADLAEIWTLGDASVESVEVEYAWEKVKSQTGLSDAPEETPVIPLSSKPPKTRSWRQLLAYAAVFVLLLSGFIYFMVTSPKSPEAVRFATQSQMESVTLPDGSVATLNAFSSLIYPETFAGADRMVSLEGEAFFEVKKDPQHPFIVQAGKTEVRVLGTSFNVNVQPEAVSVYVETGKVRFTGESEAKNAPSAELIPGESATFEVKSQSLEVQKEGTGNVLFWKNRVLNYQNRELGEVAQEVSELYPGTLRLGNPALASCRITTTLEAETLEEVAGLLAATFNLEVTQNGNELVLNGESCQ